MMTFEELAAQRKTLKAFCRSHVPSLGYFLAGYSFYFDADEDHIPDDKASHITSSVTCYGSLFTARDAEEYVLSSLARCKGGQISEVISGHTLRHRARKFVELILQRADESWTSDGSARIYCECRALPFVIEHSPQWNDSIERHVRHALSQLDSSHRPAIGEADPDEDKDQWYPPNAYHTYWMLKALSGLKEKYEEQFQRLNGDIDLDGKISGMRSWARAVLAFQNTLHIADSSTLDTDQLSWALAIVCSDSETDFTQLAEQDFIRQSLKCLFSTQTKVGTWPHYAPLFHYKLSGNAYCYVFETFAALLETALSCSSPFFLRSLRSHSVELINLWEYARATQHPVTHHKDILGWSSGHRFNKKEAESWATASVFQYSQALRKILGVWTRQEAERLLPLPVLDKYKDDPRSALALRSSTWTSGVGLTDMLFSLFVHPRSLEDDDRTDPDREIIHPDFARSAILFGPPGASKTTMIRNLARAIDWTYVEIHSSHFVADGLSKVQKTADEIFKRLYELDHAVILFDEIDELVRERDRSGEAYGRFLTTSMLPKLAELWDSKRVLYFVATNHIEFFDRAITRAERFDAVWFVSPPSYDAKKTQLLKLLRERGFDEAQFDVPARDIEETFQNFVKMIGDVSKAQSDDHRKEQTDVSVGTQQNYALAKFMLLRWDELDELAMRVAASSWVDKVITKDVLRESLVKLNDGRWRPSKEYLKFSEDQEFDRRDYGKINVWKLASDSDVYDGSISSKDGQFVKFAADKIEDVRIPGFDLERSAAGEVRLHKEKPAGRPKKKRRP